MKGLHIANYAGENLPSWMVSGRGQFSLHNLVRITLRNLSRGQQISELGHLPFLKFLDIDKMGTVICIGNEFYGWSNLSAPASSFKSLKVFTLDMCDLE